MVVAGGTFGTGIRLGCNYNRVSGCQESGKLFKIRLYEW